MVVVKGLEHAAHYVDHVLVRVGRGANAVQRAAAKGARAALQVALGGVHKHDELTALQPLLARGRVQRRVRLERVLDGVEAHVAAHERGAAASGRRLPRVARDTRARHASDGPFDVTRITFEATGDREYAGYYEMSPPRTGCLTALYAEAFDLDVAVVKIHKRNTKRT